MGEITYIKYDKRDKDTNVPPPVRIFDVERKVQELVRVPERAELASRGGVGVGEVATSASHIWAHVLLAGRPSGWVDGCILNIRTGYLLSAEP